MQFQKRIIFSRLCSKLYNSKTIVDIIENKTLKYFYLLSSLK